MPVDLQTFKRAHGPLVERILLALNEKPGQALSIMDLIAAGEGYENESAAALAITLERWGKKSSATWDAYTKALEDLVTSGQVARASVAGANYYVRTSDLK